MTQKILIIDMYSNALFFADRLIKNTSKTDIEKIIVISETIRPSLWESERLQILTAKMTMADILEIVKQENIDTVVNFSSFYGSQGIYEAIESLGVTCIGSSLRYSNTEYKKREFRLWLIENGFKTPKIIYEGMFADIQANLTEFSYPLVIKPDMQMGPSVKVCNTIEDLSAYLQQTASSMPYVVNAAIFVIEEHIPLIDNLYVTYYLCDGKPFLSFSNRLPLDWKTALYAGECPFTLIPNPSFEPHHTEVLDWVNKMNAFTNNCIGTIQCAVTADNELYFIESNARPATAALGFFNNPLPLFEAMRDKDPEKLEKFLASETNGYGATLALMHREENIKVDYEALNNLPGFAYWANSVDKIGNQYSSYSRGFPSFLHIYGETVDEIVKHLNAHLQTIKAAGNFLNINPEGIEKLYKNA